ncbi:MAG: hypothetical protein QXV83_01985 [Candidatus Anstonellaceae archaeon]
MVGKKTKNKKESKKPSLKKVNRKKSTKAIKKEEVEKELATEIETKRKIPQTIQESLNQIKQEMKEQQTQPTEIEVRKTPFVLDKVYLQSITFEIASMRQALDRIGQKLDKLEKELAAHRKGE